MLRELLEGQTSRLTAANFPSPGRSCTITLSTPRGARAFKVKGLALCTADRKVSPPSAAPYLRENPHFGFDREDRFCLRHSGPAPLGGILVSRAATELRVAASLCASQARCGPRPLALLVFCAPARMFGGDAQEEMGVAVLEYPDASDLRVSDLIAPEDWHSRQGLFQRALAGLGRSLREFHRLGWYRFSATPDNYSVAADGRVVLVDLDSTQSTDSASPRRRWLETLRDVASALFNTATAIIAPERSVRVAASDLRSLAMFEALLRGYGDSDLARDSHAIASQFDRWFLEGYERVSGQAAHLLSLPASSERLDAFRKIWLDRQEAFAGLMTLLAESDFGVLCLNGMASSQLPAWRTFVCDQAYSFAGSTSVCGDERRPRATHPGGWRQSSEVAAVREVFE